MFELGYFSLTWLPNDRKSHSTCKLEQWNDGFNAPWTTLSFLAKMKVWEKIVHIKLCPTIVAIWISIKTFLYQPKVLMNPLNVLYVEPCPAILITFYFLLLLNNPISSIMVLRMIIYEGVGIELFTHTSSDWCEGGPYKSATFIAYGRIIIKLRGDIVAITFMWRTNSTLRWFNSEIKYGFAINAFAKI